MAPNQTLCSTGTALYTVDYVPAVETLSQLAISEWVETSVSSWTYISATKFSVVSDKTAEFQVGRRIQATSAAVVIYGRITASSYLAPITTVTVVWDSGALDPGGITDMKVSLISSINSPISADMITSGTNAANIVHTGTNSFTGQVNLSGTTVFSGSMVATPATPAASAQWSGTYNVTGNINSSGTNTYSGPQYLTGQVSAINSIWDSRPHSSAFVKTASFSVATSNMGITYVASASVPITFTLPAATSASGTEIIIKNISSTPPVTIAGEIDGETNPTIAGKNSSAKIFTDGNVWRFQHRDTILQPTATNYNRTIDVTDFGKTIISLNSALPMTVTIATPAVFTAANHGYSSGQVVGFTTTASLPDGVNAGYPYYVVVGGLTASNFEVATAPGGTAINSGGAQAGTHTVSKFTTFTIPATSAVPAGFYAYLKNMNPLPLTLSGSINGVSTVYLYQYDEMRLVMDGTYWSGQTSTYRPGTVIGLQANYYGELATSALTIPYDDTIPQISEGAQFMTITYTPKSATSKLLVESMGIFSSGNVVDFVMSIFRDSGANAIGTTLRVTAANTPDCVLVSAYVTAGSTNPTTFIVRAGGDSNTTTFNGASEARKYGGGMTSYIRVTEIAQ
jgi:hypothetical protein